MRNQWAGRQDKVGRRNLSDFRFHIARLGSLESCYEQD